MKARFAMYLKANKWRVAGTGTAELDVVAQDSGEVARG